MSPLRRRTAVEEEEKLLLCTTAPRILRPACEGTRRGDVGWRMSTEWHSNKGSSTSVHARQPTTHHSGRRSTSHGSAASSPLVCLPRVVPRVVPYVAAAMRSSPSSLTPLMMAAAIALYCATPNRIAGLNVGPPKQDGQGAKMTTVATPRG
jgi:hypothetical protein